MSHCAHTLIFAVILMSSMHLKISGAQVGRVAIVVQLSRKLSSLGHHLGTPSTLFTSLDRGNLDSRQTTNSSLTRLKSATIPPPNIKQTFPVKRPE